MKHATSRMLFSYWDGLRGERAAPERREVAPGAIRHILADTFVAGREAEGRLAFRLAGTRCAALFGRELAGVPLGDLWCLADRRDAESHFGLVLSETCGIVAGLRGRAANGWVIDLEMTLFPLRHHGHPDQRALGSLSPAALPSWIGLIPVVALETRSVRIVESGRPEDASSMSADTAAIRRSRFVVYSGDRTTEAERSVRSA